jgi:hypothetical protein
MEQIILGWIKVILEYGLKLPWTWVALIFILYYRKELRQLFSSFSTVVNRIEKIRSGEIDFFLKSEFSSSKVDQQSNQHFNLINAYQSPIVTDEERLIHQQLKDIKSEEAVNILVKHLAYANLQMALSNIKDVIYYEQQEILHHLNTYPGCNKDALYNLSISKNRPFFPDFC